MFPNDNRTIYGTSDLYTTSIKEKQERVGGGGEEIEKANSREKYDQFYWHNHV